MQLTKIHKDFYFIEDVFTDETLNVLAIQCIAQKNGKILAKNSIRPALDVNTLPVQDLSIFEDITLHRPMMGKIYRMAPVETQRGCPYACRFCNSPEKNEFYDAQKAGRFFRKRTMKHVHEELKEIYKSYSLHKHTANTITSLDKLYFELRKIRNLGYSVNEAETFNYVYGVGAPILDNQNRAIAAISLSGTKGSVNVKTIPFLAKKVTDIAKEISSKLLEVH